METKVIIFIVVFFLILAILAYKRKSKKKGNDKQKKGNVDRPVTSPQGRTINKHLLHVINKDNNEH